MMSRAMVIVLLGILCRSAVAEKNFWGHEICHTNKDCSGLETCDSTFGCTVSVGKVAMVVIGVFVAIILIIVAIVWLCIRNICNSNSSFRRPNNQYLPQTIITTNTPAWNQQQVGVTTVYPHNPYPNQFYSNTINPPAYTPNPTDDRVGVNAIPSAPYPPAGYGYPQQSETYHSKH